MRNEINTLIIFNANESVILILYNIQSSISKLIGRESENNLLFLKSITLMLFK